MNDGKIPPVENHARYDEWRRAHDLFMEATKRLDRMGHYPEGDPGLQTARSEWREAKIAFEAVCAKID